LHCGSLNKPMSVIKYIHLPFQFDAEKMQEEVKKIAALHWQLHYQTLHYTGGWSAIPLRSIKGRTDNIIVSPLTDAVYENTSLLQGSSYFSEVMANFHCPLKAVRLMKLNAGAVIKEHKDAELCYEMGEIRIHIPVATNDEVEFYLDKERMNLKEGECWYMNFNLPHAVANKSNIDRIHLVIDAVVNDWVKELFQQPGSFKAETEEPGFDIETKRKIIASLRAMSNETATRMADEMSEGLGEEADIH
jgi:Aspartyl/Asparaginyl beta-hydroxylase